MLWKDLGLSRRRVPGDCAWHDKGHRERCCHRSAVHSYQRQVRAGITTVGPSLFRTYLVTLKSIVWKEYLKVLNTAL